jgi:hypothetical protein
VIARGWLWAAVLAATVGGWGGARFKQGQWDAAELDRTRRDAAVAVRRIDVALDASAAYEKSRAAVAAEIRKARHAVDVALQAPLSCPPGQPLQLGDLVLPAAVLDGVRGAAAVDHGSAGNSAEPGQPL